MISKKLNCPVCDRKEIEDNICPNCETDLSLIRMLEELPHQETKKEINFYLLLVINMLILLIGISLGWLTKNNFNIF